MRAWIAAFVALASAGAGAESRPAAGGVDLFRALERSPQALVVTFGEPQALDGQAYAAEAVVQTALRDEQAPGARLQVAWEELARARPVRFASGDRVLVALERLPGQSIWRQRIADPERLVETWTIAESGGAFTRDPSVGSVQLVEHFLALPPALRDENPGVAHLVRLAEAAEPILAGAAVARLSQGRALNDALDEVTAGRLVAVLVREPPEPGEAALALIERDRPERLRPALHFRAPADASGPARIYAALGALDDSLDAERVAALWRRDDSAAHRAVAARYTPAGRTDELARRLRSDPAAEVRAAAVLRLAELSGRSELDRLLFAMQDAEPQVRLASLRAVADLGAEAVPGLKKVADTGTPEAAQTAVGALRLCGPEGIQALRELAASHPDESVRTLARAALGGAIGHQH